MHTEFRKFDFSAHPSIYYALFDSGGATHGGAVEEKISIPSQAAVSLAIYLDCRKTHYIA